MLEILDLEKTYDNGFKALSGVSLSIPKGMFGLLGPNGAGKSTLMRTLATLQSADQGSIDFDGIDILNNPNEIRKRLGYLPQNFGVYPKIPAIDLLNHLAILKGIADKKQRKEVVEGLLDKTNLYQHRKNAVSGYSGGMRQRFGIAQALLGNPDLLIVDEPTSGLDPEERNRFHNLLVGLSQDKVIILSTHIVEDVFELCPNMAVMAEGEILKQGNPSKLIAELDNNIWKKIVKHNEVAELEENHLVISKKLYAGKTIIHVQAPEAPEGFESTPADLEDVYFATLGASESRANSNTHQVRG